MSNTFIPLLTVKELSEKIRIKPVTLYAWAEMGKIPSIKLNGAVRFDWTDILQWMKEQRKGYTENALTRGSGRGGRR